MKMLISIFQTVSFIIVILIIIIFLLPMILGIKPFIVLSGSMEPEIKTGAIAYVNTHVKVEDIRIGDIIGFGVKDAQVTHRVININEDSSFTTKGDANENEDLSPVKFENYIGKTIFSIPYIGKIISLAQTRVGYFIIFIILGLNFVFIIFEDDKENDQVVKQNNNSKMEEKV